jgi:hypothetical protein
LPIIAQKISATNLLITIRHQTVSRLELCTSRA